MKKLYYKYLCAVIFTIISLTAFSQPSGPPPAPGGEDKDTSGGGAPVGSGTLILVGLVAIYGGVKLHNLSKKNMEEIES